MSDHHLSDERLSALLDGDAPPDTAEHVDGCTDCAGRLAALRAVAEAVAAPVTPPPDAWVDRAVAAAVEAAGDAPAPAPVRRLPVRSRPTAWLAPVAAALLLLVGVVAVVGRDGPTVDRDDVALEAFADEESDAAGPVDVGDLGEVDDPEALRALLASALGGATSAAALGDGTVEDMEAPQEAGPPAPVAGGGSAGDDAPRQQRATVGVPVGQCLAAVRGDDPGLTDLLVAATVTWQGTEAVVYGFATGDEHLSRRVYVLDASGCGVLEVLSFSE